MDHSTYLLIKESSFGIRKTSDPWQTLWNSLKATYGRYQLRAKKKFIVHLAGLMRFFFIVYDFNAFYGYIWSVNNRNHLSKTFDTENYISLTYVN